MMNFKDVLPVADAARRYRLIYYQWLLQLQPKGTAPMPTAILRKWREKKQRRV
jgi:hypothetical protein